MDAAAIGITENDFESDSSLEEIGFEEFPSATTTTSSAEFLEIEEERDGHAERDIASNVSTTPPFRLHKHKLDTYIYPINLEKRDYQQNIVRKALVQNVLCALPTGLGKTFIASTVMLNFYRWTVDAKVIFVAPTRPLVSQQIEACLGVTGIPRHDSTVMIGSSWTAEQRSLEWQEKRVFFATPQIVENDLKKGLFDARQICCLVIDEAHRATGNYAYVEVVRQIRETNPFVRILALTATPAGTMEGVQGVIDNLFINSCEIRTEESLDTRQYVHKREITRVKVEETDTLAEVTKLFSSAITPMLTELNQKGGFYTSEPGKVTQFGILSASKKYAGSAAARSKSPVTFRIRAVYGLMIKLGHAMGLLKVHGIRPFYEYMNAIKKEGESKKGGPGKILGSLLQNDSFQRCMSTCEKEINNPNFFGHGKLLRTAEILNDFFIQKSASNENDSRAIVFVEYRESAVEVIRIIQQMCGAFSRAHLFVGQASTKGGKSDGMKQKEQQKVVEQFRSGEFNVLVCTSIGEEGLDIGQVDLIILYDQSRSPIRNIQRMGRTGRKREGRIFMLMTEQEEEKAKYAMKGHKYIQDKITKGQYFNFVKQDRRIFTKSPTPVYEKIEIPDENAAFVAQEDEGAVDSVEKLVTAVQENQKKRQKRQSAYGKTVEGKRDKKQKVFVVPENVELGIVSASSLMANPGK